MLGAFVLLLFGLLTVYSGHLLWRLHMTYSNGITMGNIAESVSGKALMWLVFGKQGSPLLSLFLSLSPHYNSFPCCSLIHVY